MWHQIRAPRLARIVLAMALLGGVMVGSGAGLPRPVAAADGGYFPETGHTLSGPLRDAWLAGGGLWVYGYPISEPFVWKSAGSRTVVAQYFERARLEYHPAYAGTPNRVLGGLLGYELTAGRDEERAFQPVTGAPWDGCEHFAQTGHSLCDAFQDWWHREGGLPVFGYPISEPLLEDGDMVQYFERARFEYHAENADSRWEVELGHLGTDDALRHNLLHTPPFARVTPILTTARHDTTLWSTASGGEVIGTLPAGSTLRVVGGPSYDAYLVNSGELTGWAPFSALAWTTAHDPRAAASHTLASLDPEVANEVAAVADVVSIAVYDAGTGRLYAGGASGPVAGASLSKVLLTVVALKQVEQSGAETSAELRAMLSLMIEFSDNDVANTVWTAIGGQEGVMAFTADQDLPGFVVPDPFDWGAISGTAADWARLLSLLGDGQILSPANTALALELMENEIEDHRWGVLAPGDDRISVGKNGWYDDAEPAYQWRVNSAGFVDTVAGPLSIDPLVVVVLTRYPGDDGMAWGVDLADMVVERVVATEEHRWWRAQAAEQVSDAPYGLTVWSTLRHGVDSNAGTRLVMRAH
jgi:hypothetical protein